LPAIVFGAFSLSFYPETQAPPTASLASRYREPAQRIISAALAQNDAYRKLEELCIKIGHRLSGSAQLEKAIDWAIAEMKRDGHENVRREKVMVPHWVRGRESVTLLEPRREELVMLGLGGSIATPPEGITAPVVVVSGKDELEKIGEAARGKIVLFNNPMPPYDLEKGSGYGTAVQYRGRGATLASKQGAVACLVRSVTARSLRSPHTGAMRYAEDDVKIPAAAISTEDADTIARLCAAKIPVVVNLKMEGKTLPDAESANVVGELRGSTNPDEVVVIGGHIDSWDVGHGAHDDGGGCVMAMEAISVLRKLDLIPRRTIRVVLWTNEENGLAGAKAYAKDHEAELPKHVAAIEADSGVFRPTGYSVECKDKDREARAAAQLEEIVPLLTTIGPMKVRVGHSGADVGPMKEAGVMLMGHSVEGSTYFDYHHTLADTIDKIDPQLLSQNVAAMATVAYILADMPEPLGSGSGAQPREGVESR
jgi:carboxypeptidase Q